MSPDTIIGIFCGIFFMVMLIGNMIIDYYMIKEDMEMI